MRLFIVVVAMSLNMLLQDTVRPITRDGTAQPLLRIPSVCIWTLCMVRGVANEVLAEGDGMGIGFSIGRGGRGVWVRVGGFVLGERF